MASRWPRLICAALPGLPGAHNHQNACAAYAACRSLGLGPKLIEAGVAQFCRPAAPQPDWWANGPACASSMTARPPMSTAPPRPCRPFHVSAGLRAAWARMAASQAWCRYLGSVVKAYLIGHSARDFALELGDTPYEICETMDARRDRRRRRGRSRARWCFWPPRRPALTNIRISKNAARISPRGLQALLVALGTSTGQGVHAESRDSPVGEYPRCRLLCQMA